MTIAIAFAGTSFLGHGHIFADPRQNIHVPNGQLSFFLTGTTTPLPVYSDAALTTPITQPIIADGGGTLPPIYLNPFVNSGKAKIQLKTAGGGTTVWTVDPYWIPQVLTTTSNSLRQNPAGEITIPVPSSAIPGLVLNARPGSAALWLVGASTITGGATEPALDINNSKTTGAQIATFAAANKPGTATTSPSVWLPILADGVVYYIPCWSGDTSGSASVASGAQAQAINADQVIFNGDGTVTLLPAGVGTANPTNWYFPTTAGIGASYWIDLSQTSPNTPVSVFNTAAGNWQKIGNGLAFNLTQAGLVAAATYALAQDNSGIPGKVVASTGTMNLTSVLGVQNQNLIGGSALGGAVTWAANGTSLGGTFNNYGPESWFTPVTASVGTGFWLKVTVNSGTITGITPGTFTNIGAGAGITITAAGSGPPFIAQGTYVLSSSAGGTPIVAAGQWYLNSALA